MGRSARRPWTSLALITGALGTLACGSGGGSSGNTAASPAPTASPAAATEPLPAAPTEPALLDAVFRINIERIEVFFDLYPAERRVQAQAASTAAPTTRGPASSRPWPSGWGGASA
jgi:hypothetical protein